MDGSDGQDSKTLYLLVRLILTSYVSYTYVYYLVSREENHINCSHFGYIDRTYDVTKMDWNGLKIALALERSLTIQFQRNQKITLSEMKLVVSRTLKDWSDHLFPNKTIGYNLFFKRIPDGVLLCTNRESSSNTVVWSLLPQTYVGMCMNTKKSNYNYIQSYRVSQ